MEKQIITFSANEQILKKTAGQELFADDVVGYIEAHFDLGDNWSGYDSIRAVWFTAFAQISTVLDQDGVCLVPPEVCNRKEAVNVNLVGSIVENDELTDRLTTYPIVAFIFDGNARVDGTETAPVTPSQFEQFVAIVEALVGSVKDIDHATLNADYTLTIYYSDGTSDTVGPIRGEQGPTGPTGNGIASIAKTGTSGTNPVVDTYTITYTNGQTTTFAVTNGVKGDTGNGIESIYLTGTSGAVKTYTILMTDGSTFEFEVTDGEVTQAVLDQTVEDIEAGIYESTIVQVKSDTDPYFFRETNNGNGCGHTCHDEIVGASVGFNQLQKNAISRTSNGITYSFSDGTLTVSNTASATSWWLGGQYGSTWDWYNNHIYLVDIGNSNYAYNNEADKPYWYITNPSDFAFKKPQTLFKAPRDFTSWLQYKVPSGVTVNASYKPQVFDLTAKLGSTIADYIYTLEQGTAGSGVSFFKRYFGADYYPYSAPTIRSVEGLVSHDMVGFNQWDEEWETGIIEGITGQPSANANRIRSKNFIKVLPSTTYYCYFGNATVGINGHFYTEDGTYLASVSSVNIKNRTFTTPANAGYMKFNTATVDLSTYNNDICINISDPDLNGQYKPYEKHSYPLDSTVTLRGKFDLVDGKLKANGDVWKPSEEIERKWGEINLNTLNWVYYADYSMFYADITGKKVGTANVFSANYADGNAWSSSNDKCICGNGSYPTIYIKDTAYSDATLFKQHLTDIGAKAIYELATPTTETATPYAKTQKVDPSGTEEYVSTGVVPIGHNTEYPMTLIDTMPKANGSYTMHLTVANGKRVVSWS